MHNTHVLSEKVWFLAVLTAFSSIIILTAFALVPIFGGDGIPEQTKSGLDSAIRVFDELRKPEKAP